MVQEIAMVVDAMASEVGPSLRISVAAAIL